MTSSLAPSRLCVSRGSRQPGCCSRLPARCSPELVRPSSDCECFAGVSPVAVGARVGAGAAPAVALGVAAGFSSALLGVIALGPTPEIEPDPLRAALLACLVGALAGTVVVGGVATTLSARSVDSRPRHHWLRWVPWELAVVALAIASYARLDRAGGVRLVGSQAQGGDLLAQAFPLLALGRGARGPRPTVALAARADHARVAADSRFRCCIGFRRLSADAGVTVLAALAVGLVIGSVALSTRCSPTARPRCCARRRARSSAPTSSSA